MLLNGIVFNRDLIEIMFITPIKDPFPFLQIKNLYSEEEVSLIWKELEFLNCLDKLQSPEKTGSASNSDGILLKNNKGLFLENLYSYQELSNILILSKKLFEPEILDIFSNLSFGYKIINKTNFEQTLVSYYENGGYYKPHKDNAIFTAITWFFKEPRKFTGGNFYFTEYDYKIEIENNLTILFPSFVEHAVDEVKLMDNSKIGSGRYALSQFLYHDIGPS